MTGKRGAQPGNHNSLKHGFYSETFRLRENGLLSGVGTESFEGEIDLLRVLIKRTTDKMEKRVRLNA